MAEVEIKTHTKPKTVNFYHIEGTKKDQQKNKDTIKKIDNKLEETYNFLKNKQASKIETVDINDENYYICAMDKAYVDEKNTQNFAWLISLSRLDKSSQVEIGDLSKAVDERNEPLKVEDTQGRVIETQFLYDINTNVCAFANTTGGVNRILFTNFLKELCSIKSMVLAIIPDQSALNDLNQLQSISAVHYKIANVKNFSNIQNNANSELKDLEYAANNTGAKTMEVILKAEKSKKMNLKNMITKAKFLFNNSDDLQLKKLQVDGVNAQGSDDFVDLIKHKLIYHGSVQYNNIITVKNMFNFLAQAYGREYSYCYQNFQN